MSKSKPLPTISLLVPYYRNPETLKFQLKNWKSYGRDITKNLKIIIVDDGSPEPLTLTEEDKEHLDISLYRIKENIPWNISGAKNLLVDRCETDWFIIHDMDHYMRAKQMWKLFSLEYDREMIYHLTRMTHTGKTGKQSIITMFMNRTLFYRLGGYDEDFAGVRANLDQEFLDRAMARQAPIVWATNIVVHSCQHIEDSCTTDWPIVKGLTEPPRHTGKSTLRFHWRKVC